MSVDHFCSSRKLSSALREREEQGEEAGERKGKTKGGGELQQTGLIFVVSLNSEITTRITVYNHHYKSFAAGKVYSYKYKDCSQKY